jgi:diaminopropionate ammonia-lyase
VKQILAKDESHRFGLNAFKALGASYAVYRFLKQHLEAHGKSCPPASEFYRQEPPVPPGTFTFCTATDGNHGRGIAWIARKLRQRAVIYMPHGSVQARIENIKAEGAEVIVIDGNYDAAVSRAAADAEQNGWHIISDTSWPGYEEIPRWIMAGYTTMFREIHEPPSAWPMPDVVIVQAGVGALAAAAAWYYNRNAASNRPRLVSVEPTSAACLLESIQSQDGDPVQSRGKQDSIMAGLNCGTPSLLAWPIVKRGFDLFVSVSDDYGIRAMQSLFHPQGNDKRIVSGESGAAGLAALLALVAEESLALARSHLGLDTNSTVLLLNTEGDTDPDHFHQRVRSA